MSAHGSPAQWGDAFAGRLSAEARAELEAHAQTCEACQRVRARVARASDTFATIREQAAPELPWDSVRARVHWSVSKQRRERTESSPSVLSRMPRVAWAGIAIAAVAAGTIVSHRVLGEEPPPHVVVAPIVVTPAKVTPAPAALAGVISRVAGRASDIVIDGTHPADLFARRLGPGSVIATGEGRVDIQFGEASAFAVGPRSTLELRRFDAQMIELRVDGTIDIEVGARAPDQRFIVVAGEHTVEVRGTQFQVRREAARTTVACRHGLVAVRDGAGQVNVAAARRIAIPAGETLTADHVVPLSVDELAQLADATPLRVPLWTDADTLLGSSAPLEIASTADRQRDVRVDGIELGAAPLLVRVMPGRHTVEAADLRGRFRRVGWVDVAVPRGAAPPVRVEVVPEPAPNPSAGIAARRTQLRAGIDGTRLARCTRSLSKSGLTDTFVQVEISVDASGAVGFLNVIDTDLPSSTASCVREILADVRFAPGAAATWRERVDL